MLSLCSISIPSRPTCGSTRARASACEERGAPAGAAPAAAPVAGMAPRLCAALIDAAIVGGIAAIVLYITLEVCGMQFRELRMLPLPPSLDFLLSRRQLLRAADRRGWGEQLARWLQVSVSFRCSIRARRRAIVFRSATRSRARPGMPCRFSVPGWDCCPRS